MTNPARVSDVDVLIAGAGPVGLVLAAELARRGVGVRIIDQNSGPGTQARAIAIHARTLEIFAGLDLLEPVLEAGQMIHGATVFANGRRVMHFAFDEIDSPYRFALDLPQSETERILIAHLEANGVSVERRTTLAGFDQDSAGVTAFLRREDGSSETARVGYLCGCDGAQSTVRHTIALPCERNHPAENYLLADVHIEWNQPEDEWSIWLHEDGLLTVFPLAGGLHRVVADSVPGSVSEADLRALWASRTGDVAVARFEPSWLWSLRLEPHRVTRYADRRVMIAGDAAHAQSPAGGQGMNTGIQDAFNLAWKLALVAQGKSPQSLLASYTAEREPVARGVLDLTDRITSIATLRHPLTRALRDRAAGILSQLEVVEQRLVNRLGETAIHYRSSPLNREAGRWYGTAPRPGDRAPALPHSLEGTGFQVLLFAGESPGEETLEQFTTLARYMRDGYGPDVSTVLVVRRPIGWDGPVLHDVDGSMHHRYGAGVPAVFVLRPDRYIGFRSLGAEPLPVLEYFGTLFDAEPHPM